MRICQELKEAWDINGFMFPTEELLGLSVSSGMKMKVIYNFYLPGQACPGVVELCYEASEIKSRVNVYSELCGCIQFSWTNILALSLTSFKILDRLVIILDNQFLIYKMGTLKVPAPGVVMRNELVYTRGSDQCLTHFSSGPTYHCLTSQNLH